MNINPTSLDSFKSSTFHKVDKNYCCVIAFMVCFDTTFDKAWAYLCNKADRVRGKGLSDADLVKLFASIEKSDVVSSPYSKTNRITVKKFKERHPIGTFYVCSRGHAFAIVDGVVYDYKEGPRRQITFAKRIYLGGYNKREER